ncbi:MAG: SDR family oxidoreductase [Planctomycetes bacterium]|nr:SDR family oxidoreductase [Planctomycetota bacterium]
MGRNIFDLSDRVAIVTGSASGFGRCISIGFARYGANVVCADINTEGLRETIKRVKKKGQKGLAIRCDVTRQEDVDNLVACTMEKFGTIDILVNSVDSYTHAPPSEFSIKDWMIPINTDLKGTFMCCQAVGRVMEKNKKGSIINMTSIIGLIGTGRGNSAFAACKGGINGLTRDLAIEWAPYGIRVNAIAPCQFRTEGFNRAIEEHSKVIDRETLLKRMISNIPLGRIGEPEEIVGTAVYLASDASSMVTGHILHLDGGYLAR